MEVAESPAFQQMPAEKEICKLVQDDLAAIKRRIILIDVGSY